MAAVQVSDEFLERMKYSAKKAHRSVPKQIEYLVGLGEEQEQKKTVSARMLSAYEEVRTQYHDAFEELAK